MFDKKLLSTSVLAAGLLPFVATAQQAVLDACVAQTIQSLPAAYQRLAACNRDVALNVQALSGTAADVQAANTRPNPQLSAGLSSINTGQSWRSRSLLVNQADAQVRLDQTLERGDKRALRTLAAQHNSVVAYWAAAEQMRSQRLNLAQAWIDFSAASERVQLFAALLKINQDSLEIGDKRLKAGDIAANDRARLAIEVERAQADVQVAQADRARAQAQVAALLAVAPNQIQVNTPSWTQAALVANHLNGLDFASRPDVAQSVANVNASQTQRQVARSTQTRDVSVGASVDRYPAPSGNGTTLGVYVSLPIFAWHRNEGAVLRAEADYTQAGLARIKMQSAAEAETARLWADVQSAEKRAVQFATVLVPGLEKLASAARLAYQKGAASMLELLDATRQLRQAQLDAVAARAEANRADAALRAALAGVQLNPASPQIVPASHQDTYFPRDVLQGVFANPSHQTYLNPVCEFARATSTVLPSCP